MYIIIPIINFQVSWFSGAIVHTEIFDIVFDQSNET